MAYSLACADSGTKCPGKFVTETEKELMQHVHIHMEASHPDMVKNPPPADAIKKMIKQV
jgi:predicted small metal-binding protein